MMLGEMLKVNQGLLWIDLSDNEGFDDSLEHHMIIIDSLIKRNINKLKRV